MRFALIYLIFFTLDIFIVSEFNIFGMIPYNALVSAVSLYTMLMIRNAWSWNRRWPDRSILGLWIGFLLIILFKNLANATYRLFWAYSISVPHLMSILSKFDFVILFIAVILLMSKIFVNITDSKLEGWLLFSSAAAIPVHAVAIFVTPVPVWLYRFGGILGLPMIFGWLMINLSILDIKYSVEYEYLRISDGRG